MSRAPSELPPPDELEAVLALPPVIQAPRHIRSTLVIASVSNLRAAGLYDRWHAGLAAAHRDELVDAVPGAWLSFEAGRAHYAACDALSLSPERSAEMGRATLDRVGDTLFGSRTQMTRQVDASPWSLFPNLQRAWSRGCDGGAIGAYRIGAKEARLDLIGCLLCESPFFRAALRGWITRLVEPLCAKVHVTEARASQHAAACFRTQWV